MADAGIAVDIKPLQITARELPPVSVQYGGDVFEVCYSAMTWLWMLIAHPLQTPKNGGWNVTSKQFINPATVQAWGVVIFDTRARIEHVQQFISKLFENMNKLGAYPEGVSRILLVLSWP